MLVLLSIILFSGCTDKENAEKFLIKQGYTDITITGYKFLYVEIKIVKVQVL